MSDDAVVRWLAQLERRIERASPHETVISVAYVAGRGVALDEGEVPAAVRRALLVLAAGGDPHRGLDLDGPAVTGLARELDAPPRRTDLHAGLQSLHEAAAGLPRVRGLLSTLLGSPDLAWRAWAAGVLADALDDEG